jgi:sugar phosphate isomerase/epimerase
MVKFTTTILRFGEQGEKTGWTYIEVPADVAQELKPNNKQSFRVKGKLDDHGIKAVALMPMGGGNFIMPLNAQMRKAIGKRKGAMLTAQLEADNAPLKIDKDFLACLNDEPAAAKYFNSLAKSHQNYI